MTPILRPGMYKMLSLGSLCYKTFFMKFRCSWSCAQFYQGEESSLKYSWTSLHKTNYLQGWKKCSSKWLKSGFHGHDQLYLNLWANICFVGRVLFLLPPLNTSLFETESIQNISQWADKMQRVHYFLSNYCQEIGMKNSNIVSFHINLQFELSWGWWISFHYFFLIMFPFIFFSKRTTVKWQAKATCPLLGLLECNYSPEIGISKEAYCVFIAEWTNSFHLSIIYQYHGHPFVTQI